MVTLKKTGVFLSRFAPLHKGHQLIMNKLIKDFGLNNSLLIIGSSTSYNLRTPYTLKQRIDMIKVIYSNVKFTSISDINLKKEYFKSVTLTSWLRKLKSMQNTYNSEFVFYGGSDKDIGYLKKDFQTYIPFKRKVEGQNISATMIRKLLEEKKYNDLKNYLDERIIRLVIKGYKIFKKSSSKQ